MKPYFEDDACSLYLGDCVEVLRDLPDASIDAVTCDPPYSLSFMGREWDSHGTPRAFQAWCEQWAAECLRVLKPGGHLLAFGAPRTYHRLASGIEDAGFEIRDSIPWLYSQGFPKGVDIAKAIDKRRDDRAEIVQVTSWLADCADKAGVTRGDVDQHLGTSDMGGWWLSKLPHRCALPTPQQWDLLRGLIGFDDTEIRPLVDKLNGRKGERGDAWKAANVIGQHTGSLPEVTGQRFDAADNLLRDLSADAKAWDGWNTQLKPAHEPIVVARKTTGFNTTVANVIQHGTGALNIDACRTEARDTAYARNASGDRGHAENRGREMEFQQTAGHANELGRWPTNVVFSHSAQCVEGEGCAADCPVAELDAQSGTLTSGANPTRRSSDKFRTAYGDFAGQRECTPARGAESGGASRFFPAFRYEAKAPKAERPKLADGTQHVSVKPLDLMRWLVRLVTPPNGTVLDPFAGSGTTLEAAVLEGFNAIGIEREPEYAELCVQRLSKPLQPSLFGEVA